MARVLLLIFVTLIWGFGFIATRWTLVAAGPFWASEWRFLLAGTVAAALLPWRHFKEWKIAIVAGVLLFLGTNLQTWGLAQTSVAKSAFFTTTYALFVPAIAATFLRQKIVLIEWAWLLLAMLGVSFMCNASLDGFNLGDGLTIGCAIAFAGHILWIDRHANTLKSPFGFNLVQTMVVMVLGLPTAFAMEGMPTLGGMTPLAVGGFIFLAFGSTLIAFGLQVEAQKGVKPHIVSTIFLLESPVAACFAWLIMSEALTPLGILGAVLIMVSALGMGWRSQIQPKNEAPTFDLPHQGEHVLLDR